MSDRDNDRYLNGIDEEYESWEDDFSENEKFWRDLEESAVGELTPEELAENFCDLFDIIAGLGENRRFTATPGNDRAHAELFEAGYKWRTNCKNDSLVIEGEKRRLSSGGQERTIAEIAVCQTAYDCNGNILPNYVSVWTSASQT